MDLGISPYDSIEIHKSGNGKELKVESTLAKHTLAYSPIITNIIPKFKVNVNKPFRGIPSTSFNDDDYQVLIPNEMDSQLDAFSDDESENEIFPETPKKRIEKEEITIIKPVQVLVKLRSLSINGIEFGTKSEIRSSCVIPSALNTDGKEEEDSLFISLKSGFVLLIRLYFVPRQYMDSDYTFQTNSTVKHTGNSIFKPFVLQWWETSLSSDDISLTDSGFSLHSHKSGLAAVSTSASGMFRIYNLQVSNSGTIPKKHHNVKVDGLLLHSCFVEPINGKDDDHVGFFTLAFTKFRRLVIHLITWSIVQDMSKSFKSTTLPLYNSFNIPIFVVPVRNGFLFVNKENMVIVSIHNILSADYDFITKESPWLTHEEFPTSYYKSMDSTDDSYEVIFISTDAGNIYSVIVEDGGFTSVKPIAKIPEPISVFSFEKVHEGFNVIYSCDNGGSKNLLMKLPLELKDGLDFQYTDAKLIRDNKNWAPLLDVSIIKSNTSTIYNSISDQELWGISGSVKRSKINFFKYGYPAIRTSDTYEILRKADKLFYIEISRRKYILCSFPYRSVLIEYQHNIKEAFTELSDARIITGPTIFADTCVFDDVDYLIQVSANEVLLSSLTEETKRQTVENKIFYCDRVQNYLLLVVESPHSGGMQLEIYKIKGGDTLFDEGADIIEKIHSRILNFEPSTAKFLDIGSSFILAVGSFSGSLLLFRFLEDNIYPPIEIDLSSLNPYYDNSFIGEDLVIPHDICFYDNKVLVGSKDGYSITLAVDGSLGTVCEAFLKIGTSPVTYSKSRTDTQLIFMHCRYIWLLNLYESRFPRRVHFDETYERSVFDMVEISIYKSTDTSSKYFAVIRDDGLSVCSISTFAGPCVRQVSLPELAIKLNYLDYLSVFIILCKTKNSKNRLKFFDRKSLKLINHQESSIKNREDKELSLFSKNEDPVSSCVWSIFRNDHLSKKVLIGCRVEVGDSVKGSMKLLDIAKGMADETRIVSVKQLTSFEVDNPISNIVQINNSILFASKNNIYFLTYDAQGKRLKPVSTLASFPSEIMDLNVYDNKRVVVTTNLDSVYQLDYSETDGKASLEYIVNDPFPNNYISQARLNSKIVVGDRLHSSIATIEFEKERYVSKTWFHVPSMPRVFEANFKCIWVTGSDLNRSVLTIGVNGEIGYVRDLDKTSEEYQSLMQKLKVRGSIEEEVKKLDRPFFNKVSGTGLLSLNKPIFDYKGNEGKFIDYDLEEISKVCSISFSI
ncbi:mono-functional DNA-alkylating methyl methanesulfonate N-term-domain-containing protein [Scheffersomyces coipomensis]|uniref:mono-functional DNA-alkylating methyl methanesulfonate N-term-domain-containing protein n=1 Tax=Scheffersomyces coipomensis TaxID=1788519 RepID=UPI00315D25FE